MIILLLSKSKYINVLSFLSDITTLIYRNLSVCLYELPLWTKVKNTKVTIVSMKNVIEAMENIEKRNNFFTFVLIFLNVFLQKIPMLFSSFPEVFFFFYKVFF